MGRKSKKQLEEEAKKDFYERIQYMIIRYTGECDSKKYKNYKWINIAKHYKEDLEQEEVELYYNLVKISKLFKEIKYNYPSLMKRKIEFRYLQRYLKSVEYIENIGKKEGFLKAREYFNKIFHKASCYSSKILEYKDRKDKFQYKKEAPLTKNKAINFLKAYIFENNQKNMLKTSEFLDILEYLQNNI